jgi:hypothetical protein
MEHVPLFCLGGEKRPTKKLGRDVPTASPNSCHEFDYFCDEKPRVKKVERGE